MSILFYLSKQSNDETLSEFSEFIIKFFNYVSARCLIVCEIDYDKNMLINLLQGIDNKEIINIYDIYNKHVYDDFNVKKGNSFNNYLYLIEPTRVKLEDDVSRFKDNLSNIFIGIISRYNVKAIHLNINKGMFRSVGVVILQEVSQIIGIPFYMIFVSFVKGRYTIYDSIYFNHKRFEIDYISLLEKGVNSKTADEIEAYFKQYKDYELNVHVPEMMAYVKRKIKRFSFSLKDLVKFLKRFYRKNKHYAVTLKDRNQDNPYILYLLTKPNHWYTSYSNPELLDRGNVARNIWLSMPARYDLILKAHPRMFKEPLLEEIVSKMPGCYIVYDPPTSFELISNARIIIVYGSTSMVLPLMQKKHVIEIGKRSLYFNIENPPVKRVENLADLRGAIEECLNEEPPVDRIYAYFNALFKNSYPYSDNPNKIIEYREEDMYHNKIASILFERMTEDGVL